MNELVRIPEGESYGDETPEELIETIKDCAKEARNARADWLTEAQECYDFVAGHQWTDDEMRQLRDQRRPPVVFNRIEPVINGVAGLEVTNRQEVRYLPRELGDSGPNEVLTGAAQWVRDECNAEDEESEAFLDMAVCGEGWTETRLDYEYDKDGSIPICRVDPMEMLPEPNGKKNYEGANYLIREKMVPIRWVKETWPDKAEELIAQQGADDRESEAHLNVVGDQYNSPGAARGEYTRKMIKLTEYQYKKRVPFYRVEDPQTQSVLELDPDKHDALQRYTEKTLGFRLKSVKQFKCIHYRAFAAGDVVLEHARCPDPNSYTYHAMTAKRDKKRKCWYGLVRAMLDPQRWANKFFSQSMFILNTNAKGGVIIEKDATDDMQKFEQSWAHPDKPTIVNAGTLAAGKLMPKTPPAFPPQLGDLLSFCIQSIYQVSGVSPEMLGAVDREQAAVLEYQRKQAGVTILATLFDALRKYRKEQGKSLLYLIQTYMTDGRLVRIVGKEGAKYVPLTRQEGFSRFDVVIDESPSSPNMKEKTMVVLQQFIPWMIKSGIPIPKEVVDYLPLPQSLIDAMKKPPSPEAQQQQQMQQQLAVRGAVAEVSEKEASAQLKQAQAQNQLAQAQTAGEGGESASEQYRAVGEVQIKDRESRHAMQMAEMDAFVSQMESRQEQARKDAETASKIRTQQVVAAETLRIKEQAAKAAAANRNRMN